MRFFKCVGLENKNGVSLIETILAVAIIAFVVPAIIVLGIISLRSSNNASRRGEASKLASAGIEAVKYVRDNCGYGSLGISEEPSYLKIDTTSGNICGVMSHPSDDQAVLIVPNAGDPDNKYYRLIKLERYENNSAKVTVTVSWGNRAEGEYVINSAIVNNLSGF